MLISIPAWQGRSRFVANEPDHIPGGEDPKLASLEDGLRAARRAEEELTHPASSFGVAGPGEKSAQRVISTLVGYPIGGGVVGWLFDEWLGTRPWIMLVLLFLGFAGACYQVFKISKERPE
jgi:ATP synthase protein I